MNRVVQLVLIGWIVAAGYGQAMPLKDEIWHKGTLELVSGTTLDGELNYNWKAEIVQIRLRNGTVKAYSAFQVTRFDYYDELHSVKRTFAAMDFKVKPTLERRLFLEECATGPLMVFRRLRHQHEPIRVANPAQFGTDELLYDDLDRFVYYVYDDSSVTELSRFDRDLWPRMKEEFGPQLTRYRLSRHLDINSTLTKLLIISEYNSLKSVSLSASAPSEVLFSSPE